ncbi:MAG: class I SAM-dependent methyltransferase [Bacteroidota bacterium]
MQLLDQLGKMDIYLLDQLMKNRIPVNSQILDAGCGYGRNSEWFIRHQYPIYGIDQNREAIEALYQSIKTWNPSYPTKRFEIGTIEKLPYKDRSFDFVFSSAVLHFAQNRAHFIRMFDELCRVLKPNGILWFRMTTKHTLETFAQQIEGDVYALPDESIRYLLDRQVLVQLMKKHDLIFLEPFKTVNVSDLRTMATVVLQSQF